MKAVFCDVCKKAPNRWYVIDVRGDASNPNVNVGDMIQNLGNYQICTDCFENIKERVLEYASED